IPVPTGDLVAAVRATSAPNAVAYAPVPGERSVQTDQRSVAMARAAAADGKELEAHLSFGEGFAASAEIAVEIALRTLAHREPGAWTPGQLYGTELAFACGARRELLMPSLR